ncbi:hypothetical protein EI77_02115 [Prosthecobacter fusiformis]|uniref:SGNH/GDSL hydrolase family protein n=1 Tax=Prosthecobacter fusiformis TaxID=48464 RepID=A0A4R7S1X5_9BACT|nr:hypothetical protein [Prosthecobacter fusiformis]TDU70997.1 hypothetical protein EI77_02115 [Prosthecobacter fusiformis]
MTRISHWLSLAALALLTLPTATRAQDEKKTLNVLFIGNSYTARHNLSTVVKAMAEAGNPGLTFNRTDVIYGGRTLKDHWQLGTQNIVSQSTLTKAEAEATIAALEKAAADPKDKYAKSALARHRSLLPNMESNRQPWDIIVLQSYRDDLTGDPTLYAEYAPKFAALAKAQGARVVLYETTPTTQNEKPLTTAPDPAPVLAKERAIAALANRIAASVAPMALVVQRCQEQRPDITHRFINDAHLNQNLAYLTACTLYAAIFEKSPVGLPIDSITDIRTFEGKPADKTKDRDGLPLTRTFSDKDRADLQRISWEAWNEFQKIR